EISDKKEKISKNSLALAETIRQINEVDSSSLVEIILSGENLSEFWDTVESLESFQVGVRDKTKELVSLKKKLTVNKFENQNNQNELVNQRSNLSDQKQIIDLNKKEKDNLLTKTKNKESNYKQILREKEELREAFEQELKDFESQLKIAIDPESIPDTEPGVLSWPVSKVYITQYFGKTKFSTKNPQIYNGKGHTGVDFRASTGTKIKTSLGGVVSGVGNTDAIKGCYSYGKWVLIKHDNGLSTLYAHLSLIKVDAGETVNEGDVIGYSGNTGYSTGPHLHYGVYATQGVQIKKFDKSINCKNAYIPIADYKAYLNPLSYLPKI
ncbi:murein hydrolase activator EnvC family protein, partial [Patescibacteria group bacterium]